MSRAGISTFVVHRDRRMRGTEGVQMLAEETEGQEDVAPEEERIIDASGNERRRALRRRLPFGRGAVLVVGERAHIVGLADVSVTGAYLTTRAPVGVGETHLLRLLLLPDTVEVELRAKVVRVALGEHESSSHPKGVAVRFLDADGIAIRRLKAFVAQRLREKR
jgi:Tfp pilus assembly protein PilZ